MVKDASPDSSPVTPEKVAESAPKRKRKLIMDLDAAVKSPGAIPPRSGLAHIMERQFGPGDKEKPKGVSNKENEKHR